MFYLHFKTETVHEITIDILSIGKIYSIYHISDIY